MNNNITSILLIAIAGIASCNPTVENDTPVNKPSPETPVEEKVEPEREITNLDTFTERSNAYKGLKPEKDITVTIDGIKVRILAHPRVHFIVTIGEGPSAGHGHGQRPEIEAFLSKPAENKQVAAYITRRAIQKALKLTNSKITPAMLHYATPSYATFIVDYK